MRIKLDVATPLGRDRRAVRVGFNNSAQAQRGDHAQPVRASEHHLSPCNHFVEVKAHHHRSGVNSSTSRGLLQTATKTRTNLERSVTEWGSGNRLVSCTDRAARESGSNAVEALSGRSQGYFPALLAVTGVHFRSSSCGYGQRYRQTTSLQLRRVPSIALAFPGLCPEPLPTPRRKRFTVQTLGQLMKPTSQLRSRHRRGVIIDVKQRASFPLAVVGQAAFLLEPVVQRGIGKRRAISSDSSANSTNGRARRRQA